MGTIHRVVVANDHALIRAGVCALLSAQNDIEVVAEVDNARDALSAVAAHDPTLVLMDLSKPRSDGADAIRRIKARFPATRVLLITMHKADTYVSAALRAGADGYLLKDDSSVDLISAVRSVLEGKGYLSPGVARQEMSGHPGAHTTTPQEVAERARARGREAHRREGHTNKQGAEHVSPSTKTVERHRARARCKSSAFTGSPSSSPMRPRWT
jgi:DNA-binding NarL/FixJ family response regulator